LCDRASFYYNDVNNQQDETTFSFINILNSEAHVSGDKFAHLQEHFLTVYWQNAPTLPPTGGTGLQQCLYIVLKAVYTVKNCSLGWANLSLETCRAETKRLINEKVVESCWLFTSL
jgi:hypothetical protein